jgi:hypothetical protein
MQRKRLPRSAGGPQSTRQRFDPCETDPDDLLRKPPSKGKTPHGRDDSSNVNPQRRPR